MIIQNLPLFMCYVVQGYIFFSIFNFILFKKFELRHLLLKSVVVSFVLKVIFDFIISCFAPNDPNLLYIIGLFVFSAGLALGLGLIVQAEWFNKLLEKINIKRTVNENIWDDIIKPNCWLLVYSKDGKRAYYGKYCYGEEFKSEPIITLVNYMVMDMDGKILADNTADDHRSAVLNLKDFERIEIAYEGATPEPDVDSKNI